MTSVLDAGLSCRDCGAPLSDCAPASGRCSSCAFNARVELRRKAPADIPEDREAISARLCADGALFWWTDDMPGESLSPPLPGCDAELLAAPVSHVLASHVLRVGYSDTEPIPGYGPVAVVRWRIWLRSRRRGYVELTWDRDGDHRLSICGLEKATDEDIQALRTIVSSIQRRGVGRPKGASADFLSGLPRLEAQQQLLRRLTAAQEDFERRGIIWTKELLADAVKPGLSAKTLRGWCRDYGIRVPRAPRQRR
jgi:hypothetical protein